MARGPKKHLKRLAAPSHWMLDKLSGTYAPRPSAGPHKLRESLPLIVFLRNRLKYALNGREVKAILMQEHVKVDGKVRTDSTFPAGFMDVITLEATNENFRLVYDVKGRFTVHRITGEEASYKLGKVRKIALGKRGVPYAVTHDGRTIRYPDPQVKANDTVKIDLATGKITDFIKFDTGKLAMVTGGKNMGRIGVIVHREKHEGGFDLVHIKDALENTFVTRQSNVFVIGTEAGKPYVSLPKGKGIKLSITEERDRRRAQGGLPLRLAGLNFLHTTDTHGWLGGHLNQRAYDGDWGDFESFVQHVKQRAHDQKQDLLLVDSGDRHDGNGLSDATAPNGARSLPIFAQLAYDIVTLGNHELYVWENSRQELDLIALHYGDRYVSSNVEYRARGNGTFVPFAPRFRYFRTPQQGVRVLALAFLFDFGRANGNTRVTPIRQAIREPWFRDVLASHPPLAVDVIVVVAHVPVARRWAELQLLHSALRDAYPQTVIQYFGGHSHIRDFVVLDDRLAALQSGRFCETVGFVSVDLLPETVPVHSRFSRSYIDFSVDLFMFHAQKHVPADFHTRRGSEIKRMLASARSDLRLDTVLGHVTRSNYYMDYVPLSHPKNIYKLLTDRVLPSLPRKEARGSANRLRIVLINTGSVRYDLYKGPYTVDSHYIVSPFQNDWVCVRLPKRIALQVAPKLNENDYILAAPGDGLRNSYLKPPHQRDAHKTPGLRGQLALAYPDLAGETDIQGRLAKGYVTHDDFGHTGDDTPHRGVTNHPLPNVVQSLELVPGLDADVDVVFYSFLIPNVRAAVAALGGLMDGLEFYSDMYLGLLLDRYVAEHGV
ncbi:Metallo-dependent phosphatase [Metschnikowia bicuspidata var. bicuspidata NRRL YB-4993]|uniref:40S ribosomal protein S4 n=2 Tax=Metschnikowiaceae TaxID=27319 RepID=A0A1A0HF08_9ASCO|nr:Metallo-dependent phosphatase [Metschnikowia bicuspidata var. bicuspidata NRRL YB-4993]OBA22586.1 Metallo-dependent phosphatase [Metschnikowia bicuspidata var. bicuspidata NRRL YB-4993]